MGYDRGDSFPFDFEPINVKGNGNIVFLVWTAECRCICKRWPTFSNTSHMFNCFENHNLDMPIVFNFQGFKDVPKKIFRIEMNFETNFPSET